MTYDSPEKSDWIEEALRRYERPLIRRAYKITGDIEVARDVVQDTFLKLCKIDPGQLKGHLPAWLFTVCRNRALDILKKEQRMGRLKEPSSLPDLGVGPRDIATQREAVKLVSEVLESLSDQHKEAFLLKFEDQLTYREISGAMGKSLGTVNKLITTVLQAVRKRMTTGTKLAEESLR